MRYNQNTIEIKFLRVIFVAHVYTRKIRLNQISKKVDQTYSVKIKYIWVNEKLFWKSYVSIVKFTKDIYVHMYLKIFTKI